MICLKEFEDNLFLILSDDEELFEELKNTDDKNKLFLNVNIQVMQFKDYVE
jgi:hypothetical protein